VFCLNANLSEQVDDVPSRSIASADAHHGQPIEQLPARPLFPSPRCKHGDRVPQRLQLARMLLCPALGTGDAECEMENDDAHAKSGVAEVVLSPVSATVDRICRYRYAPQNPHGRVSGQELDSTSCSSIPWDTCQCWWRQSALQWHSYSLTWCA
jgi:hypothetical protein